VGGDNSAIIATGYGLDGSWIEFRSGRGFPYLPKATLELTMPSVQWVPGHSLWQSGRGVSLTTHHDLAPWLRK
jgi:hypothetical protein